MIPSHKRPVRHPSTRGQSLGEADLAIGFQNRGIHFEHQQEIVIEYAVPDFRYLIPRSYGRPKYLCIYLDGPHHERETQRLKDQEKRAKLVEAGHVVKSLPYRPPFTKEEYERCLDEGKRLFREVCMKGDS